MVAQVLFYDLISWLDREGVWPASVGRHGVVTYKRKKGDVLLLKIIGMNNNKTYLLCFQVFWASGNASDIRRTFDVAHLQPQGH